MEETMHIIIVGCGKVGRTLAEQLQEEEIDLTLIDTVEKTINDVTEDIDAMGIVGNGASINTLMEAGISTADILIAVTASDELNLLCCLIAQKTGSCQTIARVRNPIYSQEIGFIKEKLGISMIINPEYAAAQEISRLLRFPAAIKIDPFSRGKVELLKFKVLPEFHLDSMSISRITEKFRCDILFCAVENKDELTIPGGDYIIHDGDFVSIIATPQNTALFFKKIGFRTNQVKNALIIGGGTISYYLAKTLIDTRIHVKIIEKDENRCEELCDCLPKVTVIHGDATDHDLLSEEGVENVDAFVALTGIDEENIILSLYAKSQGAGKIIAKVNEDRRARMEADFGIDSIVSAKTATADAILSYVRARKNSQKSANVETMYQLVDEKVEALEFIVKNETNYTGITLKDLKVKPNNLIACIVRKRQIIIPNGNDSIEAGDSVIVVTMEKHLEDLSDIIAQVQQDE